MTSTATTCGYRRMHDVKSFITVGTAPSSEPVTTAEAKTHCRIDSSDEDTYIDELIKAARELVEVDAERALLPQTLVLRLDEFPDHIELRRCPVRTVSTVKYYDTTGTLATLAADKYRVDAATEPGRIASAWGVSWPSIREMTNAVEVTFTAGYDDTTQVPAIAKHAIKLLVGHWYRNRESVVPGTISKEIELAYEALINRLRWGGYV